MNTDWGFGHSVYRHDLLKLIREIELLWVVWPRWLVYWMTIPTQYTVHGTDGRPAGKTIAWRNGTVLKCTASVTQYRYKRWVMSSELSHWLPVMWHADTTQHEHVDSTRSVLPITSQLELMINIVFGTWGNSVYLYC